MPGYAPPVTLETARDRRIVRIAGAGAGIDHDIDGRQLMLVLAKGFSDQSLEAIAFDRAADDPCGD